jgi:hypothetical protein
MDMMDMRGIGEIRWLVCDVARWRIWLMTTGEALVKGSRLNYSFIGELFM